MSIYIDIKKDIGSFHLSVQLDIGNEALGLLGSSGCGKSMTLKCIAGIVTPDEGEIILNDKVLFNSKKGINIPPRKRNTGLMFQGYSLFPNMTVAENIGIGILNKTPNEKKKIVNTYLEILKIKELANRYPKQLSGGQQQRVALARMMAKEPDILMLDEPFSALDSHLRFSIEDDFLDIIKNYQGTVIYVSHSIDEVYRYCDSAAIMSNGTILEKNSVKNIFTKPTTLMGAKLTGCKNISPIKHLKENLFLALDWGITFDIKRPVGKDVKYIGIRERDIYITHTKNHENCFELSIENISHFPFDTVLIIKPICSEEPSQKGKLICRCSKDEAEHILKMQRQYKLYGFINQEDILLLK